MTTTFSPAPKPAPRDKPTKATKPRKPIAKMSAKRLAQLGGRVFSTIVAVAGRTPVKVRNAKRAAKAFLHDFGSRARQRWIKRQPCVMCELFGPPPASAGPQLELRDNAHTGPKPGKGLKSHHRTIVPACRPHHTLYDDRVAPFDRPHVREAVEACAPIIAARWDALVSEPPCHSPAAVEAIGEPPHVQEH